MDILYIGQRIRLLRKEMKKTLLDVATEANLSVGFMSQVERNLTGISISSLVNVAKALNVPLGSLLDQPRQEQPDSHEGRRQLYTISATKQQYERLSSSFPGSLLNAVKVVLPVAYRSEWVAHGGDEFVYVLSGHVQYNVVKEKYLLGPGDSIHFDAQQQHRVTNASDMPVEMIAVNTLQLFDDTTEFGKTESSKPRSRSSIDSLTTLTPAAPNVSSDHGQTREAQRAPHLDGSTVQLGKPASKSGEKPVGKTGAKPTAKAPARKPAAPAAKKTRAAKTAKA